MAGTSERRTAERYDTIQLISYKAMDQSQDDATQGMGKTLNLSESGALIEVYSLIEPLQEIEMFFFAGRRILGLKGRIVRHFKEKNQQSLYCGVQFVNPDRKSLDYFRKYLSYINRNRLQYVSNTHSEIEKIPKGKKKGKMRTYVAGPSPDYLYIVDEETYKAGSRIIRKGHYGSWIYVILEGSVDVMGRSDRVNSIIQTLGPGSIIGELESALIKDYKRQTSVMARTPLYLGILDNRRLFEEYRSMSNPLQKIIMSICNRLKRASGNIEDLVLNSEKREFISSDGFYLEHFSKLDKMFEIVEGNVVVAYRSEKGFIPIVTLSPGDVYGNLPLLIPEMNNGVTYIMRSPDAKQIIYNTDRIKKDYYDMSLTYKNIMSNYNSRIQNLNNVILDYYSRL